MNPTQTPIKLINQLSPARWQEYRELRLQALTTDPTSFARTHAEDAALPNRVWQDHLIAAQTGKKSYMVFAQQVHTLVGMIGALISQGDTVQHKATIMSFYVAPSVRNQGIGTRLLEALLKQLTADTRIEQITVTVNTKATSAIALYEAAGFKKIGVIEKALRIGNQFHDEYLMIKFIQR